MSNKKVLVLGGNFAGLTAALSVKQELGAEVDVTDGHRVHICPSERRRISPL
jgi:NADH dehydrogenase FAD-containing subunit